MWQGGMLTLSASSSKQLKSGMGRDVCFVTVCRGLECGLEYVLLCGWCFGRRRAWHLCGYARREWKVNVRIRTWLDLIFYTIARHVIISIKLLWCFWVMYRIKYEVNPSIKKFFSANLFMYLKLKIIVVINNCCLQERLQDVRGLARCWADASALELQWHNRYPGKIILH